MSVLEKLQDLHFLNGQVNMLICIPIMYYSEKDFEKNKIIVYIIENATF